MRARTFPPLLATLALLAAPAAAQSSYGPANFWGGYKDHEIAPGVWRIRATANAASGGQGAAKAMAHYRAAELLKAKGFSHVRVLDIGGWGLFEPGFVARGMDDGPGYATVTVRGAVGPDDLAGCRARTARYCYTIAADALMASARRHFTFRPANRKP